MIRTKAAAAAFCLSLLTCLPAQAQQATPPSESRGELLYSVHCSECHATEVHWREKKLATTPERLVEEVQRWKNSLRLDWNEYDVNEVARYLDAAFYHFAPTNADSAAAGDGAASIPPKAPKQPKAR